MSNPARFAKYLLLERIGVGGMAEVFKAKTFGAEGFERLVAIKRILPHLVEDEDFVKMFIDEAKIAVRLQHPNIVAIHDLGRAEGTLYIAMEFVPGRDLRAIYDYELAQKGATPVGIACHVVMKTCEALHHAHFATGPRGEPLQVIHRDVSPQNVLVSFDGEVKVADFGLAKARGRMVQTQAGVVKGKLAYMSPEQLRGDDIDHRVDVFGLGILLFELLTGTRLFMGASDMDTLRKVYDAHVPPMREINANVPPELEAIVRRALAKNRDERYGTALELHDDLQFFAYSSGCYAGTSALRSYLRQVFPDAAPTLDADLPPFATAPAPTAPTMPAPTPRETYRPPVKRQEMVPPAPPVPDIPLVEESLLAAIEDVELIGEATPTERPPAPAPAVVAQRVIATGRPAAPEHSRTVPASTPRMPSEPPGLYDGWAAEQVGDVRLEPGPDTNPAPPMDDFAGFALDDWNDQTQHTPAAQESVGLPDWDDDDDRTIVVDPKSSHGR